jgi:hypothetical protein
MLESSGMASLIDAIRSLACRRHGSCCPPRSNFSLAPRRGWVSLNLRYCHVLCRVFVAIHMCSFFRLSQLALMCSCHFGREPSVCTNVRPDATIPPAAQQIEHDRCGQIIGRILCLLVCTSVCCTTNNDSSSYTSVRGSWFYQPRIAVTWCIFDPWSWQQAGRMIYGSRFKKGKRMRRWIVCVALVAAFAFARITHFMHADRWRSLPWSCGFSIASHSFRLACSYSTMVELARLSSLAPHDQRQAVSKSGSREICYCGYARFCQVFI